LKRLSTIYLFDKCKVWLRREVVRYYPALATTVTPMLCTRIGRATLAEIFIMREELDKIDGKMTFICDTDLHGSSLCTAGAYTVMSLGVRPQDIAIISHFAVGNEISTTGRGNVEQLLEEVLARRPKKLFLLDVPAKSQRFVELIAEGSKKIPITIIDDVGHWLNYIQYLWTLDFDPNNLRLQLSTSVTDGYLHFMTISPSRKVYEMALLGVLSENKFEELPKLGILKAMVPQEEGELPLPTLNFVKNYFYKVLVSVDSYMKFGKRFAPSLPITMIGNTAPKVVYLVETPLEKVIEQAVSEFPVPSDEELEYEVREFVAVLKKEAPRGQGFKYASLLATKVDTPFVITTAEGFEKNKKVIIIAPNSFQFAEDGGIAASIIRSASKELHKMLMEKGYSTQDDYPRGDAAVSIGVFSEKLQDAVKLVVEVLNAEYVRQRVDVYAAKIAENVIKLVVLEEHVAAAFGVAVRESVNAAIKHITEILRNVIREEVGRIRCG